MTDAKPVEPVLFLPPSLALAALSLDKKEKLRAPEDKTTVNKAKRGAHTA